MSASVFVSGQVASHPSARGRASNGEAYSIVLVDDNDPRQFRRWRVVGAGPLLRRVERLRVGDRIAVRGDFKVTSAGDGTLSFLLKAEKISGAAPRAKVKHLHDAPTKS